MIIYKKPGDFVQVRFSGEATTASLADSNDYCNDQVSRFAEIATTSHLTENNDYFKNVIVPTNNDVLNGRGKSTHAWQGNIYYRDLIQYHKLEYIVATPEEQKNIASRIISTIRGLNPSGRFLEMNKGSCTWCDIGDEKAFFKVRQALREGAPELRQQITPNEFGRPSQDSMTDYEYKHFIGMIFESDDKILLFVLGKNDQNLHSFAYSYSHFFIS